MLDHVVPARVPGAQRAPGPGAWLLLVPLAAWIIAFVVAPAAIMVVYSVGHRGTLGGVVLGFTLEHYATLLDPTYLGIVWRSVWLAGLTTALCIVLGYPVAYTIGRAAPARRTRLLLLVMIPFWTSFLIRTYAWITILKGEGVLNAALLQLRLVDTPLQLLYTPTAVVIGLVYTFLPFMILPIYANVEQLDGSVLEAALDLGAGPLRAAWTVVFPLSAPGIAAGVLLVFVPALGLYAVNDILGGGRVDMIGNIIEQQFQGGARNWPFGAALGAALMLAFAAASWIVLRARRALSDTVA